MPRPIGFATLWHKYQMERPVARGITPGDRCALVLSLTLGYEPRKDKQEIAERNLPGAQEAIRGAAVLDRYDANAAQLANRPKLEWGRPDYDIAGHDAIQQIVGKTGIIFISHSSRYPTLATHQS
ncbi:MAG: hypothetical protein M3Y07_09325 [Acidobacteriota bacterium]|nr:hypothetical protein [Acidobacteriota bacterium]